MSYVSKYVTTVLILLLCHLAHIFLNYFLVKYNDFLVCILHYELKMYIINYQIFLMYAWLGCLR